MAGIVINFVSSADLHNVACVHHSHAVCNVCHNAQIVGDHDDGQIVLEPHFLQKLQNLGLNGHVQCGGRLVADQDLGAAGHRNGNDHTLAHATGELVRVLLKALFRVRDAHIPQVFQRFFLGGSAL